MGLTNRLLRARSRPRVLPSRFPPARRRTATAQAWAVYWSRAGPVPASTRAASDPARAESGSGSPGATRRALLVFGGSLGARQASTRAARRRVSVAARFTSCNILSGAPADYTELLARDLPPGYDLPRVPSRRREFADAPRGGRPRRGAGRRGRCSRIRRARRAGDPRALSVRGPAVTRTQTRSGWPTPARRSVIPDEELTGPRLARQVAALAGRPVRARRRWRAGVARRFARPEAARAGVRGHSCLEVAGG